MSEKQKKNKLITDELIADLKEQAHKYQVMALKAEGALEVLLQLKDKE